MNKITKYITTGAAAMLMLMSVGAVQPNVNAARHYRTHVTRSVKKHVKKNKKNANKHLNKKAAKAKAQKMSKRNKRAVKKTVRRYHKGTRKNAVKKYLKKNQRHFRKQAKPLKHRRYHSSKVLKPRYRVVPTNVRGKRAVNRWNRALNKSGFVDGYALGQVLAIKGYPQTYNNYIFSKYAPNDKRAIIPSYMNPKMEKINKVVPIKGYRDINNYVWFQGYFSRKNINNNTKHPKAYVYNHKLQGWVLLK